MPIAQFLCLCFVCTTTVLWGQVNDPIEEMSWDDLVATVDNYQNKGLYSASLPYSLQLLNLAEKRYHKKTSRYALILKQVALAREAVGNWKESLPLRKELLAIIATVYGKKTLDYALALNSLAYVNTKLGFYLESEQLCWELKNVKLQHPLNQRYYTLKEFIHSIDKIRDKKQRQKTYRVYLDAKLIWIKNLIILSENCQAMGDAVAAELVILSAMKATVQTTHYVLHQSKGAVGKNIQDDLKELFQVFEHYEHYEKGEQLYLSTIALVRNSDLYQPLASNLATIYVTIGEYTGAKLVYTKLLQDAEKKHGVESQAFAMALADLAAFYALIEDSSEAAKLYLKAKSIILRLEGRDSPTYHKINKQLKDVYRRSQNRNE